MVHVSLDNDEKAATDWAAKHSFPWPTIMNSKIERSGLSEFLPRGVPNYKLIDGDGNVVAEGQGAAPDPAQHYKINLVLRYNSEDMDLEKGESVIRGVMKNIVYHDESLDMTKGVMQYLDQSLKTASNPDGAQSR